MGVAPPSACMVAVVVEAHAFGIIISQYSGGELEIVLQTLQMSPALTPTIPAHNLVFEHRYSHITFMWLHADVGSCGVHL